MKKLFIVVFLISLILSGCVSSKPMVAMVKDVSLANYKKIEIPLVLNETGQTFDFDVTGTLTQSMKSKFKTKGYIISDETESPDEILIIKSSLLTYEAGSAFKRWLVPGYGNTKATVKTLLIDKKTGKILGELMSADVVSAGGLYSAGADKRILHAIADGIVKEVEKSMKVD